MSKIKGIPFKEEEEANEHFSQYAVTCKANGKIKALRAVLILIYTLFCAGYIVMFTVVTKMAAVIAILPFLLWILWYFTWKHTQIEYAYVVCRGGFHFYKVNGYGNATEILSLPVSECEGIFPATDEISASKKLFYASSANAENLYCGIWQTDGVRTAVYFDASSKLLSSLRYYGGEKVTVTAVTR